MQILRYLDQLQILEGKFNFLSISWALGDGIEKERDR